MIDDFNLDEIKALLGDYDAAEPMEEKPVRQQREMPKASLRSELSHTINSTAPEATVRRTVQAGIQNKVQDKMPALSQIQEDNKHTERIVKTNSISYSDAAQADADNHQQDNLRRARLEARKARAAEEKRRKSGVKNSIPFFSVLAFITALAWIIPLRPTVSESEKRTLAEFPKFSVDQLFSGDYFSEIDNWFSDTFTFRESWISAADRFEELYGIRTVALYESAVSSSDFVADSDSGLSESGDFASDDDLLAGFLEEPIYEEAGTDGLAEQDAAEEPQPEEEPEDENIWGGVVINDEDYVNSRTVLIVNNESFRKTAYSEDGCNQFVSLANKTGDLLVGKAGFYVLLVPENGTTKLTKEDRLKYGFELEEDGFDLIFSQLNNNVTAVNCIDRLVKHNDEYTVFRTDHHWTALGAYYAYEEWCSVAGVDPVPLSEYTEYEFPGFLGTYYYSTGNNKHLGDTPDTVYAYEPPGNIDMYMNGSATNSGLGGKTKSLLLDVSKGTPGRKYMTFLGTDDARITFINNDITDGSSVMVIKTSFGNPFVYYLTQHYQYVYVVDYRYYHGMGITNFVEHFDIDDVIICAGLGFVAEKGGLSVLKAYMK